MPALHVVRVFVGPDGTGGNPLGVFLRGGDVAVADRQHIAADLGFSETVFLDDAVSGRLQIFTPAVELPFAGHPLVGTGWLLALSGAPVTMLRPAAGEVPTWVDEFGLCWIRGRAQWAPPMELRQFADPAQVDALTGPPDDAGFVDAWAWIDEAAGAVRCRVFAPAMGIAEDEATGAAAVRLVSLLQRPIEIRQGVGSSIHARPGPDGSSEIGGACELLETRQYVR